MKYAFLVVAALSAWALTGCTSVSKYDRVVLEVNSQGDVIAAEVKAAEDVKGVTPTTISELVLVKDTVGNPLYYETTAGVDKYTELWLYTARDVKSGRQLVRIPRGAHGVFRTPVKYMTEYGLVHGIFVNPWDVKHFWSGTQFASIPDSVPASWKGVAVVEEDHSLCFAGILDAAGRAKHASHVIGGVIPVVTATRTLASSTPAAGAVTLTPEQAALLQAAQAQIDQINQAKSQ